VTSAGHFDRTEHKTFSVIIINYNTCRELHACLGSLGQEGPSHVVVVDNDSSDDSVEMVRSEYP
jgi:GT2 family glycosyltransferase